MREVLKVWHYGQWTCQAYIDTSYTFCREFVRFYFIGSWYSDYTSYDVENGVLWESAYKHIPDGIYHYINKNINKFINLNNKALDEAGA